jgi:hypothetical protein
MPVQAARAQDSPAARAATAGILVRKPGVGSASAVFIMVRRPGQVSCSISFADVDDTVFPFRYAKRRDGGDDKACRWQADPGSGRRVERLADSPGALLASPSEEQVVV